MIDPSTMRYPYGCCSKCGYEFSYVLRFEYEIHHCPRCGELIDDFLFCETGSECDIYCVECGRRICKQEGDTGIWLDQYAGICEGGCDRELCGSCADWDINGECEQCRNSPCGQCVLHNEDRFDGGCACCEHNPYKKTKAC
jgi:hypothetical protein